MYVCVLTYLCVGTYVHVYVCVCVYIHMFVCVSVHFENSQIHGLLCVVQYIMITS